MNTQRRHNDREEYDALLDAALFLDLYARKIADDPAPLERVAVVLREMADTYEQAPVGA